MDAVKALQAQAMTVGKELEGQSLNALVTGFSFASAIAWMDLVRFLIGKLVNVPKNGGMYFTLTALLTTLLSIVVYMLVSRLSGQVKKPAQPLYAVTA
jgi:hypothetical protein